MLKKMNLKWKKKHIDPLSQPKIIIDYVPKGELRRLAKELNKEVRTEGRWEFFEIDLGTVTVKLKRLTKG